MRVLNRKQLAGIPVVDEGNLYLGAVTESAEAVRARLARQEMQAREAQANRAAAMRAAQVREQHARDRAAFGYAQMLERSIRQRGNTQAKRPQAPMAAFQKQFGVNNALLGFVDPDRRDLGGVYDPSGRARSGDETTKTVEPDFSASEVYRAQEFNNQLTAKDVKGYTKYRDWPLVQDARGDFGGILKPESGSADFSTWIVNDAKNDFGALPPRLPGVATGTRFQSILRRGRRLR